MSIPCARAGRGLLSRVGVLVWMSAACASAGAQPRTAPHIVVNDLSDSLNRAGCATTGAGDCTLRDAITFANSTAGHDIITFSVSGTLTLGSALPDLERDLTIDGSGQTITVSGAGQYRVFYVVRDVTVVLSTLTIGGGRVEGNTGSGGGIYNDNGTLTVSNCTLSSNYAMFRGGAIYNNHLLTVTHSVITNNHAGLGGGIHNGGGTVTLTDSTLMKNYADMVPKRGGGVYNDRGTLTVINSTITGNEATLGAGINHSLGALTVTRSTFSYNVSDTDAGGLMTAGVATVTNSTFYGNLAGELFFDGEGGGILHAGGTLTVNNVTFHRNTAYDTEAGGGASIAVDDGEVTLRNAILASNGSCLLTGGSLEADAHNLAVDGSCGKATVKNLTDLALSDLASNGGPTQTVALGAKSAAIDAGDDSVCAAPPVNSLDQRGVTRPQGAHCDVGAFERAAP